MKSSILVRKALTVVATLCLALTPLVSLSGCANEEEAIKAAVDVQLDKIKTADSSEMDEVFDKDTLDGFKQLDLDPQEVYQACVKKFSYTDNGVTLAKDKKSATVALTTTNVDVENVLKTWVKDIFSSISTSEGLADAMSMSSDDFSKKYTHKLIDALAADDAPTKTGDVDLKLVKKDGKWEPVDDTDYGKILFAGANFDNLESDLSDEFKEGFGGGSKNKDFGSLSNGSSSSLSENPLTL